MVKWNSSKEASILQNMFCVMVSSDGSKWTHQNVACTQTIGILCHVHCFPIKFKLDFTDNTLRIAKVRHLEHVSINN